MLDQNISEVIRLKASDLDKSHFSKAELERILRIYDICKKGSLGTSYQKLYASKMNWIAQTAQKHINAFANDKLSVDLDAAVTLNKYINEFGRTYKKEDGILKLVYTPDAIKARVSLAKRVYYQKQEEQKRTQAQVNVQTQVQPKPQQPQILKVASVSKTMPAQRKTTRTQKPVYTKEDKLEVMTILPPKPKRVVVPARVSMYRKLERGFDDASYTVGKEIKRNKGKVTAASLACLMAYPFLFASKEEKNVLASEQYIDDASVSESRFTHQIPSAAPVAEYVAEYTDNTANSQTPVESFVLTDKNMWKDVIAFNQETMQQREDINNAVEASADLSVDKLMPKVYDKADITAEVTAQNKSDYKNFALTLTRQFISNISEMKKGRNLYREKEALIGKYYKNNHITPNLSCESMTFATFLDVLEKSRDNSNYIHKACKDLLLQVSNPHGCYSNKATFEGKATRNLRATLKEKLKENEYGIFMIWTPRGGGNLHRQTVVGVGNGKAYLLAFNNNRAVKMDINELRNIRGKNGYYADLGSRIFERANDLAMENAGKDYKDYDASGYLAQLAVQNRGNAHI